MRKLITKLLEGWIFIISGLEVLISKVFLTIFKNKASKINNVFRLILMSSKENLKYRKFGADLTYECIISVLRKNDEIADIYIDQHKKEWRHFAIIHEVMLNVITYESTFLDWD